MLRVDLCLFFRCAVIFVGNWTFCTTDYSYHRWTIPFVANSYFYHVWHVQFWVPEIELLLFEASNI